ncbi:MAG: pilus assembly protein [Sulfitobacter sp.]|nr:pilus assembly protein [Sulfitobacter sp.]
MRKYAKNAFGRFRRDESGSVFLIEFVIIFPFIFGLFLASVEMSLYSLRQVHLNRGLEDAVRFVRLNTNAPMTHDQIKTLVCAGAGNVSNCDETLRLEMISVDPRNFATMPTDVDCVDKSEPVTPERGFSLGQQHELMVLRACLKFDPMFPTSRMGFKFASDGSGQAAMYSISAFVQEPS